MPLNLQAFQEKLLISAQDQDRLNVFRNTLAALLENRDNGTTTVDVVVVAAAVMAAHKKSPRRKLTAMEHAQYALVVMMLTAAAAHKQQQQQQQRRGQRGRGQYDKDDEEEENEDPTMLPLALAAMSESMLATVRRIRDFPTTIRPFLMSSSSSLDENGIIDDSSSTAATVATTTTTTTTAFFDLLQVELERDPLRLPVYLHQLMMDCFHHHHHNSSSQLSSSSSWLILCSYFLVRLHRDLKIFNDDDDHDDDDNNDDNDSNDDNVVEKQPKTNIMDDEFLSSVLYYREAVALVQVDDFLLHPMQATDDVLTDLAQHFAPPPSPNRFLTLAGLTPYRLSYQRYCAYVMELLMLHDTTDVRMLAFCHDVVWQQSGPPLCDYVVEAQRYQNVMVKNQTDFDNHNTVSLLFLRPAYPQLILIALKLYRHDLVGAEQMAVSMLLLRPPPPQPRRSNDDNNDKVGGNLYSVDEQNLALVMVAIALLRHQADLSLLINDLNDHYWRHTLLQWCQSVLLCRPQNKNSSSWDVTTVCQQVALRILPKLATCSALCRVAHWQDMVPCDPWDPVASHRFLYEQKTHHPVAVDAVRAALDEVTPAGGPLYLLRHYSHEVHKRWKEALDERFVELQNQPEHGEDSAMEGQEEEEVDDMQIEPRDDPVFADFDRVMMPAAPAIEAVDLDDNIDNEDDATEEEEAFHDAQLQPSTASEEEDGDQSSGPAATPERSVQEDRGAASDPDYSTDSSEVQHLVNGDKDDDDATADAAIEFSDDDPAIPAALDVNDDDDDNEPQGFEQDQLAYQESDQGSEQESDQGSDQRFSQGPEQRFSQGSEQRYAQGSDQRFSQAYEQKYDQEKSDEGSGQEYSTNSDMARSTQSDKDDVVYESTASSDGTETDDDGDDDDGDDGRDNDPMEEDESSPLAAKPKPFSQQADEEFEDDDVDEEEEPGFSQAETVAGPESLQRKTGSEDESAPAGAKLKPFSNQANEDFEYDDVNDNDEEEQQAGFVRLQDESLALVAKPKSFAQQASEESESDNVDDKEKEDELGIAQAETVVASERLQGKIGSDETDERDDAGYIGEGSQDGEDDDDEAEPVAPGDIGHELPVVPYQESSPDVPLPPPGANAPVDRGYEAELSQDDAYRYAEPVAKPAAKPEAKSGYEPEDSQNTATEEDTEDDQESQVGMQVESNVAVSEANGPPARAPHFPAHSFSDMDHADDEQTTAGPGAESSDLDEDMNDSQPLDSPTVAFKSMGGNLTQIAGQVQAHESATKQAHTGDPGGSKVSINVQTVAKQEDTADESIGVDDSQADDDKLETVDNAKDGDDNDGVADTLNYSSAGNNETTGGVVAAVEQQEALEDDGDLDETVETPATTEKLEMGPEAKAATTNEKQLGISLTSEVDKAMVATHTVKVKDEAMLEAEAPTVKPKMVEAAAMEALATNKQQVDPTADTEKTTTPDGEESTMMDVETVDSEIALAEHVVATNNEQLPVERTEDTEAPAFEVETDRDASLATKAVSEETIVGKNEDMAAEVTEVQQPTTTEAETRTDEAETEPTTESIPPATVAAEPDSEMDPATAEVVSNKETLAKDAPSSKACTVNRELNDAERTGETDPGGDRINIDKEDENPTEETAVHAGPPSQGQLKDEHPLDEEMNTSNDERHETEWDAQVASADVVAQENDAVTDREPEGNEGQTYGLVDQSVDELFDAGQQPPPDPAISRLKKAQDAQSPIPDPAAERLMKSKEKSGRAKKEEHISATTESMEQAEAIGANVQTEEPAKPRQRFDVRARPQRNIAGQKQDIELTGAPDQSSPIVPRSAHHSGGSLPTIDEEDGAVESSQLPLESGNRRKTRSASGEKVTPNNPGKSSGGKLTPLNSGKPPVPPKRSTAKNGPAGKPPVRQTRRSTPKTTDDEQSTGSTRKRAAETNDEVEAEGVPMVDQVPEKRRRTTRSSSSPADPRPNSPAVSSTRSGRAVKASKRLADTDEASVASTPGKRRKAVDAPSVGSAPGTGGGATSVASSGGTRRSSRLKNQQTTPTPTKTDAEDDQSVQGSLASTSSRRISSRLRSRRS